MTASRLRNSARARLSWLVLGAFAALVLAATAAGPSGTADAQQATATATPYVFQDNDPYLVYEGNWDTIADAKASGGTVHRSRTSGAILRLRFQGPFVQIYSIYGPNKGRVRVSIDGVDISAPIDLYRAGDPMYERIVWHGGLDETRMYTLTVEVLGQRNGASTDSQVDIDYLVVTSAERAPITPTPSITPSPTITPTATQPAAQATSTLGADRSPGSWPIDSRFLQHYARYDGQRILGNTLSPTTFVSGRFTQYFEKGRMEDHTGESQDPNWQFQYGLLVDELQIARANLPVGGDISTISYATISTLATEGARLPAPSGFTGGTMVNSDGSVFVPYSQALRPAPGHNISPIFWPYINRQDIFPGGWLHDVGLPMTEAVPAVVTKGAATNRQIFVQVFQRTILTYDPLNPADFQVERANVGTDYRRAFPDRVPQ